jgi:nucleoside-diphosphate-sugar epimerase
MAEAKRMLVTGGAGFLAYHIANLLHGKSFEVSLLDIADFREGDYPQGVAFLKGDVRDRSRMIEILREGKYDVVVHAAAALPLWPKRDIYEVNVAGTRNVVELSRHFGVERVVKICSTAVYGVPIKHPIEETDPLVGVGPYGESKILAEKVCDEFRAEGYCVPVLRPKTFVGTARLGVFQILYKWVADGAWVPVIGDGYNHYQLLEVEDLVQAIELCATAPAAQANDAFNVGAKEFKTVREDVGALCEAAGTGAQVIGTPAGPIKLALAFFEAVNLSPLYKWVYGTADKDSWVSTEKIERRLGWKPKYSNSQALVRSYEWYMAHRDELDAQGSGITHRVAWKQGILGLFEKVAIAGNRASGKGWGRRKPRTPAADAAEKTETAH